MRHEAVLTGAGLRLRPFRPGDRGDHAFLAEIAADPQARQWSRSLRRIHADADGGSAWLQGRLADPGTYEWVVADLTDGTPQGRVGLHGDAAGTEVGYWTLPQARGRGVARRAAALAARYGHEQLGLRRVGLLHAVANPASCRVALAASFRLEGTLRSFLDHGDGVRWDAHVHGRLTDDPWEGQPEAFALRAPVEVAGDGVVLRPWTHDGAADLLTAARDPEIVRWNPLRLTTIEQAHRWVEQMATWDGHATWAIHDAATSTLLGKVSLFHPRPVHCVAEAGYWLLPQARGRGVTARALRAAASYAYDELGLERVELFHAVENAASCRAALRAGFAQEGTCRSSYRYGDGRLHDEHLHARVAGDP